MEFGIAMNNLWECKACGYKGDELKFFVPNIAFYDTTQVRSDGIQYFDVTALIVCPKCSAQALLPVNTDGSVDTQRQGIAKEIT